MNRKRTAGAFALSLFIAALMIVYAPVAGVNLPPLSQMGLLTVLIGFVAGLVGATPFALMEVVDEITR